MIRWLCWNPLAGSGAMPWNRRENRLEILPQNTDH
jgi:hypothetical protein